MDKLRVLLTGAAGRIGPTFVEAFREPYRLRTYDRSPVTDSPDHRIGDLQDLEALRSAMEGMEVVVHLAATSNEAPFVENLVPNNVVGLYHTFQAAQEAGVRRIVFASTCQAVLAYPRDQTVKTTDPVRPSTLYGATKAFGEVMGRWYHDQHGLEFIGIRIGWFKTYDDPDLGRNEFLADVWLSPRDAVQIFRRAIETPEIGYAVVHGTSVTRREFLSLRSARELLGYAPEDRYDDYKGES